MLLVTILIIGGSLCWCDDIILGVSIATGNAIVDDLLSSRNVWYAWNRLVNRICHDVWWGHGKIWYAQRIAEAVISMVNSTILVASTVGTCVFFNITASDQYLAIVVPGRMYTDI